MNLIEGKIPQICKLFYHLFLVKKLKSVVPYFSLTLLYIFTKKNPRKETSISVRILMEKENLPSFAVFPILKHKKDSQ